MARVELETGGSTPLATTPAGAAGTVTGAERNKLQLILDAAKQMATSALDGLMSAADKAKLDGIQALAQVNPTGAVTATPNTWVIRAAAGYIYASYFNTSADENIAAQPTRLMGIQGSDGFIRTFNPAWLTAGGATALGAGADRNKLDAIGQTFAAQPGANQALSDPGPASTWVSLWSFTIPAGLWFVSGKQLLRQSGAVAFAGDVRVVSALGTHAVGEASVPAQTGGGGVAQIDFDFVFVSATAVLFTVQGMSSVTGVTGYKNTAMSGEGPATMVSAIRIG